MRNLSAIVVVVLLLASCRTTSSAFGRDTPEEVYVATIEDFQLDEGTGGLQKSVLKRIQKRFLTVLEWYDTGLLSDPVDQFWAAATLAHSDEISYLEIAGELARSADIGGEPRARLVTAEVTDKILMKQGLPQRYGTQLAYSPVIKGWRLYPVDPRTTDEDRARMGIPSLEELRRNVEIQNEAVVTQKLRGD